MSGDFWTCDTVWFYVSLGLAMVLIFQVGVWYGRTNSTMPSSKRPVESTNTPNDNSPSPGSTPTAELPSVPEWVNDLRTHPDRKALGDPDALVTVTEYVDFECPFCKRYTQQTFPNILENYIRTGNVYYRVKHFPLPMHKSAVPAGNAAECAARQDRFWAFKFVIMNTDRSLTEGTFADIADHIGISNMEAFQQCVLDGEYENIVNQEKNEGTNQGASATPTVFVGDTKIEGAQPFSKFKQVIEQKLTS